MVSPAAPASSFQDRCQGGVENAMMKVGYFVGTHPWCSLVSTLFFLAVCMGGLALSGVHGDVLSLWVPRGDRLGAELDFLDDHYAAAWERSALLMLSNDGGDVTSHDFLDAHYNQIRYLLRETNLEKDDLVWDYYSLCSRDYLEGLPMPCKYISPMQCFKEGGLDIAYTTEWFDMWSEALLDGLDLPNSYFKKDSMLHQTDQENRADLGNFVCEGWNSDVLIPEAGYAGNPVHSIVELPKLVYESSAGAYRFENDGSWIDGQDISGAGIDALIRVFYKKAHDRWLKNDTSVQALDRDDFALYSASVFTNFVDANSDGACSYPEFLNFIQKDDVEVDDDWSSEYYSQQLVRKYIRYHNPIDKFLGRQIQDFTDYNSVGHAQIEFTQLQSADALQTVFFELSERGLAELIAGCMDADGEWLTTGDKVITQTYVDSIANGFRNENGTYMQMQLEDYMCFKADDDITDKQAEKALEILEEWEDLYLDNANRAQYLAPEGSSTHRYASRTTGDLQEEAAESNTALILLGYVVLITFGSISLANFNSAWRSQIFSGLCGILFIVGSVGASFGIWSYIGWNTTPSQLQILPLLGLGLGADNVFVLAMNILNLKGEKPEDIIAEAYRSTMSSILLTGICNFLCFLAACLIPLPQLQYFGGCAMIIVVINFIVITFGLGAVLTLDLKRQNNGKADCCFCLEAEPIYYVPAPEDEPVTPDQSGLAKLYWYILTPFGVAFFLVVACVMAFFGIWGASQVVTGLSTYKILPDGHYATEFLKTREQYFDLSLVCIYSGRGFREGSSEEWDFDEPAGLAIYTEQLASAMIEHVEYANLLLSFENLDWQDTFTQYAYEQDKIEYRMPYYKEYDTLWDCFDADEQSAAAVSIGTMEDALAACTSIKCVQFLYNSVTEEWKPCTYIFVDDDEDLWWPNNQLTWVEHLENDATDTNGQAWKTIVPAMLVTDLVPTLQAWMVTSDGASYASSIRINSDNELASWSSCGGYNLGYTFKSWEKVIEGTRDVTDVFSEWSTSSDNTLDNFSGEGSEYQMPCFPYTFYFQLMSQYIGLKVKMHTAVVTALIIIFIVLVLFLMDFVAPFAILICLALVTFEVYGFCHWSGIALNGMMALNLIVSVGIGVEFNAHVARFYQLASPTRATNSKERVILAMEKVFWPVTLAAVSTLLGVFPVIFTAFPYFKLYFFTLYFFIIGFSWAHGILLLPCLLYIMNPRGGNGGDVLAVGSPKKVASNEGTKEGFSDSFTGTVSNVDKDATGEATE